MLDLICDTLYAWFDTLYAWFGACVFDLRYTVRMVRCVPDDPGEALEEFMRQFRVVVVEAHKEDQVPMLLLLFLQPFQNGCAHAPRPEEKLARETVAGPEPRLPHDGALLSRQLVRTRHEHDKHRASRRRGFDFPRVIHNRNVIHVDSIVPHSISTMPSSPSVLFRVRSTENAQGILAALQQLQGVVRTWAMEQLPG